MNWNRVPYWVFTGLLGSTLAVFAQSARSTLSDHHRESTLLSAKMTSPDSTIAAQAAIRAGTLQDTSLLPTIQQMLNRHEISIRTAAAFALGQTGRVLSPEGARALGARILPLFSSQLLTDRLVEESGKFVDAPTLDSIIHTPRIFERVGRSSISLGIARAAIRGVVSDDAVRCILRWCQDTSAVHWQTVYALQRIGNHPLVPSAIPQWKGLIGHRDPLVRMNIAVLAGKLRDVPEVKDILLPLLSDPDWRVRVNSVRATISSAASRPEFALSLLPRMLHDTNDLVAIASFEQLADAQAIIQLLRRDQQQQVNFAIDSLVREGAPWQRRAAALPCFAEVRQSAAIPLLREIIAGHDTNLIPSAISALGRIPDEKATRELLTYLTRQGGQAPTSTVLCGMLEALRENLHRYSVPIQEDRTNAISIIQSCLSVNDVAIISTAADVLSDSLFRTPTSVPLLQTRLKRLDMQTDIEAAQAITQTLRVLGDTTAIPPSPPPIDHPPCATAMSFDAVHVTLVTDVGSVDVELYPREAPLTVASFLCLGRAFYSGLPFHRVVPNFVAQGGDPKGDGWGGPGYSVPSEFSLREFGEGSIGMASAGKDTEGSQFFFTHSPQPHLDGRYTVFGSVVSGREIVDRIRRGTRIFDLIVTSSIHR